MRRIIEAMGAGVLLVFAVGMSAAQSCPGDNDGSGEVTVDEIVGAVNSALNGCVDPPFSEKALRLVGRWELIVGEESTLIDFNVNNSGVVSGSIPGSTTQVLVIAGDGEAFEFFMRLANNEGCLAFGMSENRDQLFGLVQLYRPGCQVLIGDGVPFLGLRSE